MSIEAMKQALEALEGLWDDGFGGVPESMHKDAITTLRQAIEQAEKREWAMQKMVDENQRLGLYDKQIAWIRKEELAYMSAVAAQGITEWRTNLGLKPQAGDVGLYLAPVHASDISAERVDETVKDRHEPESSDVEIAAEQSDNYASFLAGVSFARANLSAPPKREHELAGTIPISNGGVATRTPSSFISPPKREWVGLTDKEVTSIICEWHWMPYELCKVIEAKLKEKNT
jgi:hypothetical protein